MTSFHSSAARVEVDSTKILIDPLEAFTTSNSRYSVVLVEADRVDFIDADFEVNELRFALFGPNPVCIHWPFLVLGFWPDMNLSKFGVPSAL